MYIEIIKYKSFIISSIVSEFRARFVRSKLGGVWMILNPLLQVAIYALILSAVLSSKLPQVNNRFAYVIYLLAGTLAWSLFSEIVSRCVTIYVDHANLLKKMVFPKVCLPIIVSGTALINNILLLLAIIVLYLIVGHIPNLNILWLPLLIVVNVGFAVGVGIGLGILNVFIRDIGQVVPIILQILFWFTPIVYTSSIIPENYRFFLFFNPLYIIVSCYQDVLVLNKSLNIWPLFCIMMITSAILFCVKLMLKKASSDMVDAL